MPELNVCGGNYGPSAGAQSVSHAAEMGPQVDCSLTACYPSCYPFKGLTPQVIQLLSTLPLHQQWAPCTCVRMQRTPDEVSW